MNRLTCVPLLAQKTAVEVVKLLPLLCFQGVCELNFVLTKKLIFIIIQVSESLRRRLSNAGDINKFKGISIHSRTLVRRKISRGETSLKELFFKDFEINFL